MKRREFLQRGLGAIAGFSATNCFGAVAQDLPDIDLILCLDWSGSMYATLGGSKQNYIIQKEGHIAALRDSEVYQLLIYRRVYVRVILWSGYANETMPIFLGRMVSKESVEALADAIFKKVPDTHSLSGATTHYTPLIYANSSPIFGKKRIVDISTDEPIFEWHTSFCRSYMESIYRSSKTTVNVLAIGIDAPGLENLRENLQTPDGFTASIKNWEGYIPALKRKIMKELSII